MNEFTNVFHKEIGILSYKDSTEKSWDALLPHILLYNGSYDFSNIYFNTVKNGLSVMCLSRLVLTGAVCHGVGTAWGQEIQIPEKAMPNSLQIK